MKKTPSAICAWCRLLRIPNYFTVPGDVLAGFVLAGGTGEDAGILGWTVVLALCLYAVGILLNDLVDLEEDRRDRPTRPLPSGAVPIGQARFVVAGLLVAVAAIVGLAARPVVIPAVGLTVMIVAYDLWLKRVSVLGELCVAACRVLNLLLGVKLVAAAPLPTAVWVGGAVVFIYVFGLARIARHETTSGLAGWVGALVRGLILVQAVLISAGGHALIALGVAALWIPATVLGRRFYSS